MSLEAVIAEVDRALERWRTEARHLELRASRIDSLLDKRLRLMAKVAQA